MFPDASLQQAVPSWLGRDVIGHALHRSWLSDARAIRVAADGGKIVV